MLITQLNVLVGRGGVMLPVDSGCPWAPTASGHSHVPAQIPSPAAVAARTAKVAGPRAAAAIKRPSAVMAQPPLVDNRKQYVHMTRVNAGGDGAMGPHPEREPA